MIDALLTLLSAPFPVFLCAATFAAASVVWWTERHSR